MRADRSLIPSIGAAASLVGAVACAFFITGAIVAFHGWPHAVPSGAPTEIVVASNPARAAPLVLGHRPAATAAGAPVAGSSAPVTASTRRVVSVAPRPSPVTTSQPAQTVPATATPSRQPTGGQPASSPTSAATRPQALVPTAVSTVGDAAGAVTQGLGNTVAGAGAGLASAVAPISPPLSQVVGATSSGLGGSVAAVGQVVATLVHGLTPQQQP